MKISKMKSQKDICREYPTDGTVKEKNAYAFRLARTIVDFIFPDIDNVLQKQLSQAGDKICVCNRVSDGKGQLLRCCSSLCKVRWFHVDCVNASQDEALHNDWWCSNECKSSGSYIYCICGKSTEEDMSMIQCELGNECVKKCWYHPSCLNVEVDNLPEFWYCSNDCDLAKTRNQPLDSILEYSKALLWEGLVHIARREAIRCGDGPTIINFWKIDLIQFANTGHHKYFVLAHHLLAGINGFYPERLRHEITWNRVANIAGGAGNNLELDLLNELYNNAYKEKLRRSNGVYTEKQVQRCSRIGGQLEADLQLLFTRNVATDHYTSRPARHYIEFEDVKYFLENYRKDNLFEYVPGRHHTGFKNIVHAWGINNTVHLLSKLNNRSKNLDLWRKLNNV